MVDTSDYTEVAVKRITNSGTEFEATKATSDLVVCEASKAVVYRNISLGLPPCSPSYIEYLAVGHLLTKGLIGCTHRVTNVRSVPGNNIVYVQTEQADEPCKMAHPKTTCHAEADPENPSTCTNPRKHTYLSVHTYPSTCAIFCPGLICDIFEDLLQRSLLFKMTGASHAAALCDYNGIILWHEDIGRHNAVDKVIGHAFVKGIPLGDKILALTGRINSEIVGKAIAANIPVVASKAPPTDIAVKTALREGVTIIGFVRNRRMTIYSNSKRVIGENP